MADSKHTVGDLRQLQSLPLRLKIPLTRQRIRDWYEHWDGQVYVSFSGGKDSTVLKHIVDSMYSDIPAVFVNTGLEYPEIQRFVREVKAGKYDCFNPDVEILRPEMRFDEVIKKYGYPVASKLVARYVETARRNPDSKRAKWLRGEEWTKFVTGGKWAFLVDAPFPVSDKCCAVMKHKPINQYGKQTGRKAIIGTMAEKADTGNKHGFPTDVMHLKPKHQHHNRFPSGRNRMSCIISRISASLIARYTAKSRSMTILNLKDR